MPVLFWTFSGMDLNSWLCFFVCLCSLQVLVLASHGSVTKGENGFQAPRLFNLGRSDRTVNFYLYTRENINSPDVITVNARTRSLWPKYNRNKPLKVLIHGWKGDDNKRFCSMMREGLLKNQDINVITVDWSGDGSKNWLYPVSRSRVPEVANTVADVLDNLNRVYGVRLENVHVLGHSLGAHIAGIAGYSVKTGKIGRITGLDPAGPSFSMDKPNERLSQNSALFVDVIHTCGNYLGFKDPIGHADFFPNSGQFIQPGCGVDVAGACSHRRSYYLYIESLSNKKGFPAVACPNWENYKNNKNSCNTGNVIYMGEGTPSSARGLFYLKTNKEGPFGLGVV